MTLATTIQRIATILESTPGVRGVQKWPILTRDRKEAERYKIDPSDGHLQEWIIAYALDFAHLGVQAASHTQPLFTITTHYELREGAEQDTFLEHAALIEAVCANIMDPTTGLSTVAGDGIRVENSGRPVLLDTGHLCWEATIRFALLDVTTQ